MKCLLRRMLDETEFLSDYGIRALSRHHLDTPYEFNSDGIRMGVRYEPAESSSGLFGGNSNWRGPIWMPVNYLLIESLQKFHDCYGDTSRSSVPPDPACSSRSRRSPPNSRAASRKYSSRTKPANAPC